MEPVVAEPGDPVMIVVGAGAIALSTAQELCALQGHRVVVLWRRDPDLARAVESIGAVFITAARLDSGEGLDRAGVHHAITILARISHTGWDLRGDRGSYTLTLWR